MKKNSLCRFEVRRKISFALILFLTLGLFAQSAQGLYDQGIAAQEERNWWAASEKFQEALRVNSAYTDAWFHLAQCLYEMNEPELTLEYLQQAKKYSGGRTDILNLEGMALISLGRLDDAKNIFEQIQKEYPNDIESRFGLAQLNLFRGRLSGAETLYYDALRRNPGNVKALLSLALISFELGKDDFAERYINQAMQSHAENPQVYYIASYLEFKRGNVDEAEKKCLAAIQVDNDYSEAYGLLALICFAQGRYSEVVDLADMGISRDRNDGRSWFIKGLSQQKMGFADNAISTWARGLEAVPEDEVMRSAFELLVRENVPLEDKRREEWARYHIKKASDYAKKYAGPLMRYEYQTALRLDPSNYEARSAFSRLLRADGFSENYLAQIKFIRDNEILNNGIDALKKQGMSVAPDDERFAAIRLSDAVEGYESLLENTLASKWNVAPFYLDKTRWNLGVYYMCGNDVNPHPELTRIISEQLSVLFRGLSGTSVRAVTAPAAGYGEAYSDAHSRGDDYFILLSAEETGRDLKISADMYSARTGVPAEKFSVYKTGNNSYAQALLSLRQGILNVLPVRARLLERKGNEVLVDIGRTEGIVKDAKFSVVRRGSVRTADSGVGLAYKADDLLGSVTITKVSEDISEGLLSDTGFYDRVNARDELILAEFPKDTEESASSVAGDSSPAADQKGRTGVQKQGALRGANSFAATTPALIEMIRNIY